MRKGNIDRRVAVVLGMKLAEVSLVTDAFLVELAKAIVADGGALLNGFGSFKLRTRVGPAAVTTVARKRLSVAAVKKFTVSFSKSRRLKLLLLRRFGSSVETERGT